MFRYLCLILSIFLIFPNISFANCPCKEQAPLIPMKDFFKNPEYSSFQISPNGQYLSYAKPWKNRMNVFVKKIGTDKELRVTSATERDISNFFWKGDNNIIYLQDFKGDENFSLYSVTKDAKDLKALTPFKNVYVDVIDKLENNENEMLISMNKINPSIFDIYRVNIKTGKINLVEKNPGKVDFWLTDNNGKLRIGITTDGLNRTLLYREKETDKFRKVLTGTYKDVFNPLLFTFDNKYIYAESNLGRDKSALVKYDLANNKEVEVLFEHPEVDISNILYSKKRKVLTGVSFVTWKTETSFFDKTREDLQKEIEKLIPNKEIAVTTFDKNEDKVTVRSYSDKSLGSYYLYDIKAKKLSKLVDVSSWLKEEDMASILPITYKSRDGLTINGYLTLPKGIEAKNIPVVVNPHGGPWHRDYWGFNPEAQFLANRGYAVLQMNFRGSTGYGRKFLEAGNKEWGKKMQDDITDGVEWLIKEGIADPKKVGIYGGSYGGYATLAGLAFTPDLYACGIDYVGVSNIFTFFSSIPEYWKLDLEVMYEQIGNPEKDKALLEEVSPIFHVDKIKAPLFIAQGANDPRVKKAESEQMVQALKARGVDVIYMLKDNEGHGFHNQENKFDFYREMEKFLGQHLGGRVETVK